MDTIQEKARQYGQIVAQGTGNVDLGNVAMDGFIEGFNEAMKWIPVEEDTPCEQKADGKLNLVLIKDAEGVIHIGYHSWHVLCGDEWWGNSGKVHNAIAWRPI